jgi:hypothetical protein
MQTTRALRRQQNRFDDVSGLPQLDTLCLRTSTCSCLWSTPRKLVRHTLYVNWAAERLDESFRGFVGERERRVRKPVRTVVDDSQRSARRDGAAEMALPSSISCSTILGSSGPPNFIVPEPSSNEGHSLRWRYQRQPPLTPVSPVLERQRMARSSLPLLWIDYRVRLICTRTLNRGRGLCSRWTFYRAPRSTSLWIRSLRALLDLPTRRSEECGRGYEQAFR